MLSLKNVIVPITNNKDLKEVIAEFLHVSPNLILEYEILKESIDARANRELCYVYEFMVCIPNEDKYLSKNVTKYQEKKYVFPESGKIKLERSPLVIGAGPAGLFAAYELAKHGYCPILYERGKKIEERIADINEFWQSGNLNEESNVQFGEGGAGTFSDGKLNTLVKNKENRMQEVFNTFISCGAPKEIKYSKHPHIGTDNLRNVIVKMREEIIRLGGKINYNSLMSDLIIENSKVKGVIVNGEKIYSNIVVLAIGHSARDTFAMLHKSGVNMESKPFAVGIRIIHPQQLIDNHQYHNCSITLPTASYKLTFTNDDGRGVYTFCMCPGGYVVNATSQNGYVVCNGMSNYKRDSGYANSAIIVTVNANDYGAGVFAGLKFMEQIEARAYLLTNGALAIQTFSDYEKNQVSSIKDYQLYIKGLVAPEDINKIFPNYINSALKNAINYFDEKIPGFKNAIIVAPETRTSSPIRIIRDENFESNIKGLYPCGEGSGYAGGITTSAIDGIKIAETIAKKYSKIL